MIDTAEKRRSAAGLPFFPLGPGVTPDAARGLAWRQQSGWGYSGIAAGLLVIAGEAAIIARQYLFESVRVVARLHQHVAVTATPRGGQR